MSGFEELHALDNEESGAKAAEVSDEVFREKHRKAQTSAKALKKAEGKARKKDSRLAKVIGKFLQTNSNTAVMLLISRCLDHNIPAGLILGLLALVEVEAQKEFEEELGEKAKLLKSPESGQKDKSLVNIDGFPPHIRQATDAWSYGLLQFGLTQPNRLLATAISPEAELFPSLAQLTAFILREYLEKEKVEFDFEKIHELSALILYNVLEKIKLQLDETKELEEGKEE